ncbi:MAG: hypothetical protein JOY79_04320 [Acidobacteriaceae bacterium]|nr:hypothetical protein [Acidobacteriaceae bacterium]
MEIMPQPPSGTPAPNSPRGIRHVEHYWLCGSCSQSLTLVVDKGQVATVPLKIRAAAS